MVPRRGEVRVNVLSGGEKLIIAFDDIDIDTPVLSVRKIVRNGNHVKMYRGGGYVKNETTGKRLCFAERQGVYFIKLKILDLDTNGVDKDSDSVRQG